MKLRLFRRKILTRLRRAVSRIKYNAPSGSVKNLQKIEVRLHKEIQMTFTPEERISSWKDAEKRMDESELESKYLVNYAFDDVYIYDDDDDVYSDYESEDYKYKNKNRYVIDEGVIEASLYTQEGDYVVSFKIPKEIKLINTVEEQAKTEERVSELENEIIELKENMDDVSKIMKSWADKEKKE